MKKSLMIGFMVLVLCFSCKSKEAYHLTDSEKQTIQNAIQKEIDILIEAVRNKDIEMYMNTMPEDFIIYDESGEKITREKQKEYTLRDWAIIKKTIHNEMTIDSVQFVSKDSIYVFTDQKWERIMFRRDRINTDTVLTTQRHKELWKKTSKGWVGYDVEELGGKIYINGREYTE